MKRHLLSINEVKVKNMKKILIIAFCALFICLTSCKYNTSDSNNEITNQIETTKTDKITNGNESRSIDSKTQEIKVIYDKDTELKAVTLTKEEKDKLFREFLNNRCNIYLPKNNDIKIPFETKIIENFDEYNDLCYSIYEYKGDKLFAFLIREESDPNKSSVTTNATVYEGLFLMPIDKLYSIEDFSNIVINKSDLSDVKKIYKYADILFEQELQVKNSKKKCSINIMSENSGITINFKKSGDKYIVTKIENEANDTFASMIADVDKNYN